MSGAAVACMLDHRPTACVRNHAKDNMKAIREKERQLRMQRGMESLKMPEKQFKMKQFDNVKSRAFEHKPPLPASTDLEKIKGQRKVLSLDAAGSTGAVRRSASTPPPPPVQSDDAEDENIMSMAAFEAAAERLKAMHAGKNQMKIAKDTNGCPKYLQKIKANLAEEQREAAEKQRGPAIPAGYRLMPQEEVEETLAALKKKRENLDKEFQRLPFNIETDSQKRREKRILDDIKETEDGIKLFSKPMVIVEA